MMSQQLQQQWTAYGGTRAEVYERHLVPAIFEPWARDLLAFASPKFGDRVLDVACGTGIVARLALQHVGAGGSIVGIDLNPGMLAVAHALVQPSGLRIEWREGNVLAMPFADGTFDLALCQQGLQFFPDRSAALREIHRVLASNGRLAVSVWRPIDRSPGFAILARALGDNISVEAAAFMQGPFGLGHAEELHNLISGAGFRDVSLRSVEKTLRFQSSEDFVRRYVAGTPLADVVAQATGDARNALIADVTVARQSYVNHNGLAFPIETHLAMAHA